MGNNPIIIQSDHSNNYGLGFKIWMPWQSLMLGVRTDCWKKMVVAQRGCPKENV